MKNLKFRIVSARFLHAGSTASEVILEWGVEEARHEGPRAGGGVLGEGTASPSSPTRGFAGAL